MGKIVASTPDLIKSMVEEIRKTDTTELKIKDFMWTELLQAQGLAHQLFITASKEKQLDSCYTALRRASDLPTNYYDNPEKAFAEKRARLFVELGKIVLPAEEFLCSLIQGLKFYLLPDIIMEFGNCLSFQGNVTLVEITTAIKLDEGDITHIVKKLTEKMKCNILPSKIMVDPSIIAGVIIKLGDNRIFDGSARTKFEKLHKKIEEGIEILRKLA